MNTDTIALLDKHFDLAVNAPDGIKRLRETILTLAMQGKLVPQDPKDQPASELLKEIEAEKKRLVQEGKIKEPKPLSPIKPEEVPYEMPESWVAIRIGDFLCMQNGRAFKPTEWKESGLPIIRIQNLNNPDAPYNYCDSLIVEDKFLINKESFLISWSGTPGTSFGAFIWHGGKGALNQHIFSCTQIGEPFYDRYLLHAVNDRLDELIQKAHGAVGLQHVTKGALEGVVLLLPPLAEQRRIVAKIDELMARVDELERMRDARNEKRLAMHQAAVARLLDAGDASVSRAGRDFIFAHFGELYGTKKNVDELRKTILQLAVMGRLVPQDPQDQPASELLKEIEAEKKRFVQEGKIKEPKPLPPIKPEDVPYQVPKGWEWVRTGVVSYNIEYGTSQKTCDDSRKIPVYRMGNICDGVLIDSNLKFIDKSCPDLPKLYLKKDDILFNRTNSFELVGKSAKYNGPDNVATFASYLIRIQAVHKYLYVDFIVKTMNAPYYRKTQIEPEIVQQCGQANYNGTKLAQTLIPLPPLAEQRRIVAKVDELMALCDKLDKQIDERTLKESALLEAVAARV